jgi:N,N-dimethylformamidase
VLRGYLDQLTVAPGDVLPVRLSGADQAPGVHVLRFRHSDPNPAGPGVLAQEQDWIITRQRDVKEERTLTGSAGVVPGCFAGRTRAFTFCAWILPTRLDGTPVVASWQAAGVETRVLLRDGCLALTAGETVIAAAPEALHERRWHFIAVSLDEPGSQVTLAWGQLGRTGGPYTLTGDTALVPVPSAGSHFVLGGSADDGGRPRGCFDGKLSSPSLLSCLPDPITLMDVMNWGVVDAVGEQDILARWAFGTSADPDLIVDLAGRSPGGSLSNAPSLRVTGPPQVGSDTTALPASGPPYQTVHFHRDDLDDCGWPQTHQVAVPANAQSGCYVVRATAHGETADLPFIVRPAAPKPVLLLVPTFTWQAYANLGRDRELYPGRSHYALHDDGSPVYISTRRKPMPGLGPAARVEVDAVDSFLAGDSSGPAGPADSPEAATHLLMADLYASYWLELTGADFGVITDEDLHGEGTSALEGCQTLVLSAHPEYWTGAMLDALGQFIDLGGSVM